MSTLAGSTDFEALLASPHWPQLLADLDFEELDQIAEQAHAIIAFWLDSQSPLTVPIAGALVYALAEQELLEEDGAEKIWHKLRSRKSLDWLGAAVRRHTPSRPIDPALMGCLAGTSHVICGSTAMPYSGVPSEGDLDIVYKDARALEEWIRRINGAVLFDKHGMVRVDTSWGAVDCFDYLCGLGSHGMAESIAVSVSVPGGDLRVLPPEALDQVFYMAGRPKDRLRRAQLRLLAPAFSSDGMHAMQQSTPQGRLAYDLYTHTGRPERWSGWEGRVLLSSLEQEALAALLGK